MNLSIKKAVLATATIAGSILLAQTAGAETVSEVAARLTDQLTNISKLAVGVMFVGGLVTGGMSALKFKEHNENPNQTKLSKPVTYAFVAAALIGLPTYLKTASSTLNGDSGTNNSLDAGVYKKVN